MRNTCIDPETLAAFAEGRLKRAEIAPLLAHLETCEVCSRALDTAIDVYAMEGAKPAVTRPPWWLAVAAIVIVGLFAIPLLRNRNADGEGIARLVTLAPRGARVVEPRLSGGFAWAQYRGPMRATDTGRNTEVLKLDGAAGEIIERADRDHDAAAEHAAGVAQVLIDQPLRGEERLQALVERSPRDAKAWNDLAAARYAAAAHLERPSLYPEALAAVDKALAIEPRLTEALFNRALILEKLGLRAEARTAWQRYLEVDPSSPWANEARARLAGLGPVVDGSLFRRELPRLERAAASGDTATVRALVTRFPEECRRISETEHLGLWGEAVRRGDAAEAARLLTLARTIGAALATASGEMLLRDAVQAIDGADAAKRATLAEAHATYRQGRLVYSRHLPSEAESKLRRAAEQFAAGGSPMALVARSFAANTRFDQNDVAGARAELEALAAGNNPGYTALSAQVQWELALCATVDADWAGALVPLRSAEAGFGRLGERNLQGFMTTMLAQTYASLGRPDEAWAAWIRSFDLMSAQPGGGDRLAVALTAAVISDVRGGRREAALALLRVATSTAREAGHAPVLATALAWQAVLEAELGDDAGARATLGAIGGVVSGISDVKLRERAVADGDLASGAVLLRSDAGRAVSLLTRAASSYQTAMPVLLPETLLLRARSYLRLGDQQAAARDLEGGIEAMERHWTDDAGSIGGTGMIDAADALFEEAVVMSLARGDAVAAFDYVERHCAQSARRTTDGDGAGTSIERLQGKLRGSGVAVLELATTEREAIAFVVTEKDFTVTRTPFARVAMSGLSRRALYDALIRPSSAALSAARMLIVVPDAALQAVPFAALEDGSEPLVARMPVAIAASAASLREAEASAAGQRMTLAVALPAGEASGNAALPETAREIEDVASLYGRSRLMRGGEATFAAFVRASRDARVVHLASHTESGAGETALVFAPRERVSWKSIAGSALGQPEVIVLAACETLVRPQARQSRALSIGQAFAASGAQEIVGTLAPIADREARAIFRVLHQELAAGTSTAVALQRAQLDARAHQNGAWADVELLTTRIPR
ncbi:MAG: hypothetical protein QOH21_2036 [Acidobacteriota bacterium]|nr:hypothetical protein [Acidobacteriota bacterium]